MCDLLHIKTDRGAMIGDDQSGLSISGKPIYHFVVTSIFNGYAVIHFGCVAKINLEYPLAKVCLDATFNVTRPLKGFTAVISVLVTVALVGQEQMSSELLTILEEIVSEKQCQLSYRQY
ncbi:alcohol dehydrogenase [Carex littledalei]|uniref:alcohol dehydrogenase n=1 Tax=Carex littledalei TaxID=544730 RepID=A0A833R2H0_9POAL|nr:alcohol dehydrogenase [Carex littledalei]